MRAGSDNGREPSVVALLRAKLPYADFWEKAGHARFKSGLEIEHIQRVLLGCNVTLREVLKEALTGDPEGQVHALERAMATGESAVTALYTAYQKAKDQGAAGEHKPADPRGAAVTSSRS